MEISFLTLSENQRDLVLDWLEKEHVRDYFYEGGLAYTLNNLALFFEGKRHNGDGLFEHWVGYGDGEPFAFLTTYQVDGPYDPFDSYNKWFQEGKETMAMDVLIGAESFLG
ncbi:MAG: hypothetical protein ACKVOH_02725, partial [Chlamydiales bacterium]